MNGHDPWAYLRAVLQRLPTELNSWIDDTLPHQSKSACRAAPMTLLTQAVMTRQNIDVHRMSAQHKLEVAEKSTLDSQT